MCSRDAQPLHDRLFRELALACVQIRRGFDREVGMSEGVRRLLMLLDEHGELRHAALQERMAVDGATITRLVKRLEAEDAVRRRLDPDDNRYTLASLTAAGERQVAHLRRAHAGFQERVLAQIPEQDQQALLRALAQMRANIQALDARPDEEAIERNR
jgi:DNA-binding MarR family transcriptional regulator